MPDQTNASPAPYSPSGFLMKVKVDTAPTAMLLEGIRELHQIVGPIAESNRAFLNAIIPVLQADPQGVVHQSAREAVETGLLIESLQQRLMSKMSVLNSHDEAHIIEAAEIAQAWGFCVLRLHEQTGELRVRTLSHAA